MRKLPHSLRMTKEKLGGPASGATYVTGAFATAPSFKTLKINCKVRIVDLAIPRSPQIAQFIAGEAGRASEVGRARSLRTYYVRMRQTDRQRKWVEAS